MKHEAVLDLVTAERVRQEYMRSSGKLKEICSSPGASNDKKLRWLVEKVGEAAAEIDNATFDRQRLIEELIQVAAVAIGWVESLG